MNHSPDRAHPAPLAHTLRGFWVCLSARRRRQLIGLLALMLAGAVAEVLSLGAVVPFLAILADPDMGMKSDTVARLLAWLAIPASEVRGFFTLTFIAAVITAALIRIVLIHSTAKLNYDIGHELGVEVYRRTLYQPYEVHVARNSSEVVGGIKKVDTAVSVFLSILNIPSATVMAACILAVLLFIDFKIALLTLFGLGGVYALVFLAVRHKLAANSRTAAQAVNRRVQVIEEGLGGIRDILLDHAQALFIQRFTATDRPMRDAETSTQTIGPSPRFVVEAFGMVMIAVLAYVMTQSTRGFAEIIPVLGALALGAQRLMPLVQQTYQGWVMASGNRKVLEDVLALLQQPVDADQFSRHAPLPFREDIRFQQVAFGFTAHTPRVLEDISFIIPKGARVGFVGATGSGKSTTLDLLMGLITPTSGEILVDGQALDSQRRLAWQNNIAHVPQAIYLSDTSFAGNIAFGVPADAIDLARVRKAARQAQIGDFIEAAPQGYNTVVGERGVRLSGGQRQRIGIARALYKDASVLVLDEATSALDNETEAAVIQALGQLGPQVTILMIAHRLSTLEACDIVIEIAQGKIGAVQTKSSASQTPLIPEGLTIK